MQKDNPAGQPGLLSFDPAPVIRDVLRRWYLIVMAALFAGMAGYVASDLRYTPQYTTTTTFVVSVRGSSTTVYQNLSAATNLAAVFSEVLNSSILRRTVTEAVGLDAFHGTITAEAVQETNLLTLKVTDDDPRTVFLATRAIIENHHIVSDQVLGDTILEVLQEPRVPGVPSNPKASFSVMKKAGALAAAAVCVLLGVLSAMKDTVRSKKEAEKKLGCRVLGEIRHERKYKTLAAWRKRRKTSILITNPLTSFPYVESIRKLCRRIEQKLPGGALMVTSALENEGKSTVAVNLALALARKHSRVLLMDCDLLKPADYKILENPWKGTGVMGVATGSAKLADAVQRDPDTGLYLLLERWGVRSSTDVAGSAGMARMLADARAQFDYVVLDTPPMTAVPDAECLMELADASLLVVQQNVAAAGMLEGAVAALSGARGELLGCVLNDMVTALLPDGGGYGYGYGYGRYGKYDYGQKKSGRKGGASHGQ